MDTAGQILVFASMVLQSGVLTALLVAVAVTSLSLNVFLLWRRK